MKWIPCEGTTPGGWYVEAGRTDGGVSWSPQSQLSSAARHPLNQPVSASGVLWGLLGALKPNLLSLTYDINEMYHTWNVLCNQLNCK